MVITDPELQKQVANGGQPLIDLCRKEADTFDEYLRTCGMPEYEDGLAQWEREVIAGYLYQKIRGRLDPKESMAPEDLPEPQEGQGG